MHLSELASVAAISVVNEGEFESLGLVEHQNPAMLVALFDEDYLNKVLGNSDTSCVITTSELVGRLPASLGIGICENPQKAFYQAHLHLLRRTSFYWKEFNTQVAPDVQIHGTACVASRNVVIGEGTDVGPGAVILEKTLIGKGCIIGPNAVLGGEGYEPKWVGNEHLVIPHAGGVRLHDGVTVQANTHVSRALYSGCTEVGEGTLIGAHVDIAHNVKIGRNCEIAPCAKICGSAILDDDIWVGPNATVSSLVHIATGGRISLGAVVTRDVQAGECVSGNFAISHSRFIEFIRSIR